MKRKAMSYLLFAIGAVLLILGAVFYTADSISLSDPAFYVICAGLACVVAGAIVLMETFSPRASKIGTRQLVMAGLFAALSYVGFQFFRVDIPIGAEGKTAVHLGNAFVVLSAMFLGGGIGGLSGAVGLTLADLTSGYVTSMPKTFLIKFVIGAIAGTLAQRVFKPDAAQDPRTRLKSSALTAGIALAANVVLDPILGYLYKRFLFGIPQDAAATLAKIGSLATLVNAVISFFVVMAVYNALYPALKKNHLL